MGFLSQRILAKVSGPAWQQIRGKFMQIARLLLAVSSDADSQLFGIYVKFTIHSDLQSHVYAAVWLKSSKRLIVGSASATLRLGSRCPIILLVLPELTKPFGIPEYYRWDMRSRR